MKTETIARLWGGDLEPIRYLGANNTEIKELLSKQEHNRQILEAVLDANAKTLLDQYVDSADDYAGALTEQSFCDGFCLGIRIMVEALAGSEQLI